MPYGRLEVITGPMFSGKSTLLLHRITVSRILDGRSILVLKPSFDTRYGQTRVESHDGLAADARAVSEWPQVPASVERVFIDEVQFLEPPRFSGGVVAEIRRLLERGTDVTVSGLDTDWRGAPFPIMASLLAMADEVHKRTAHCTVCGRPATKSFKRVANKQVVELGAGDLYEARCLQHWFVPSQSLVAE